MKVRNVVLALAILFALTASPAMAEATTYRENYKIPVNVYVWVPCAADGAGESVILSGRLHVLFHYTLDGNGGFHYKSHSQPQGVSGLGQTTGDKYQGTGVTQYQDNGKVGYEYTYVNNFRIIGQGSGNNYLIHNNLHHTINANGELTAWVDNFSAECK
jgi:hypothetical protein